jgi:hypothetical protein
VMYPDSLTVRDAAATASDVALLFDVIAWECLSLVLKFAYLSVLHFVAIVMKVSVLRKPCSRFP